MVVMKTNGNGNIIWSLNYGTTGDEDRCSSIKETKDKGFVFVGVAEGFFTVTKIDSAGNIQWVRQNQGYARGIDIVETMDNGYVAMGIDGASFSL